jgi:SAM-dependent methyltransferase
VTHPTIPPPSLTEAHAMGVADATDFSPLPSAMGRLGDISIRAIADLVLPAVPLDNTPRSTTAIAAALGTAPRHGALLGRWLAALAVRGVVQGGPAGWWQGDGPLPDADIEDLAPTYAALGFPPRMAASHRLALEALPRLIRDQAAIQQFLFADGRVLEALSAYQDNHFTRYLNRVCAGLTAWRQDRQGPSIAVLELGGGAGLTTDAVLARLGPGQADYRFTDISRMFTLAAAQRFPGIRTGVLDINAPFAAQGVAGGSVDLVLAGNVLHNAANIPASLRHIQQVLRPGGWLIFTESIWENEALLSCMGFLLSPAAGAPPLYRADRRAGLPFLDADGWRAELGAAGLSPGLCLPEAASPLAAAGQCLFLGIAGDA